jgi:hypothetical protein
MGSRLRTGFRTILNDSAMTPRESYEDRLL